jgi:hypothetical protein
MPDLEKFTKIIGELKCAECGFEAGENVIRPIYKDGKLIRYAEIGYLQLCHESFRKMINEEIGHFARTGDRWFVLWKRGKKTFDQSRYMD